MTSDSAVLNEDALRRVLGLIRQIRVGFLTTLDHAGTPHARPVQTLAVEDDATLWFFTDLHSGKAGELNMDSHISLAYADTATHRYVAVSGTGVVGQDPQRARALWQVEQRAFYPSGPEDPRLGILQVCIERAEYWIAPGRSSYLYAAAKAAATGEPAGTIGMHARLGAKEQRRQK